MPKHDTDGEDLERLTPNPIAAVAALPIKLYRRFISPLKSSPSCRFYPTCSQYALDALCEWGVIRGSLLAIWRILRCNPFGGCGFDPVPTNKRRRARLKRRADKKKSNITENRKETSNV